MRRPLCVPTSTTRRIPLTHTLPPPTCPCSPSPPTALEIDRTSPLHDTIPRYGRHIVLPTSRLNWPSKIEVDPADPIPARIKALTRGNFPATLVTNSSFPESEGALVFPEGLLFRGISGLERYLKTGEEGEAERVGRPVVLVCTHGERDERCGVVGPGLVERFRELCGAGAEVQGTSHLSGHKWAGNVVIYRDGWGVWYGRVDKGMCEGIVMETVEKGRVVDGGILRGVVGAELEELD